MAFKLDMMDHVFPVPIIRFEVADAAVLNHALRQEIAGRRKAEAGTSHSNIGGWHSDRDFFERPEPAHRALAMDLLRMMAEVTRTFDPDADYTKVRLIPEGWVNVNPPGAMNAPHSHRGWFWSGSYYVDVPDGSGGIEFLKPFAALPGAGVIRGPLVDDRIRYQPKPGQVLIFPASLDHWVYPNGATKGRISIAFNGRFEAKPQS
nr:TIGR02466 family protein [uncultured Sphingomonas sp.]